MLTIDWNNEQFTLLPDKALYWNREKTLIITDPHFGKEKSFQQAGISIPSGSTLLDLLRLEKLIHQTEAERLVILGDFFHNQHSQAESILENLLEWRKKHLSLSCLLIRGNHDNSAGDPHSSLQIDCVSEPHLSSDFLFHHHPPQDPHLPSFAGHIHPSIQLRDRIGISLRSPCFLFSPKVALLPAFGSFTGTYSLKPKKEDRVFAIGENQVLEIKMRERI